MTSSKSFILIACTPVQGHVVPMSRIASQLSARGYEISWITSKSRQKFVQSIGAKFFPLLGRADATPEELAVLWPERSSVAYSPEEYLAILFIILCIVPLADQYRSIQQAIKSLREADANRRVLLLSESCHYGTVPMMLDAPGLQADGIISIGVGPFPLSSIDTYPFGPGYHPNTSAEGRLCHVAANQAMKDGTYGKSNKEFYKVLRQLGAKSTELSFLDAPIILSDRFVQCCHPELEYPRSDAPKSMVYSGGLPRSDVVSWHQRPEWWGELSRSDKKIVFVCQGTVAMKYTDLIIPTLEGLSKEDVIVVVALAKQGATLPETCMIPDNARIWDYIPYSEILTLADCFVTNGGYGGFQESVALGVPLVVGGVTEDKAEVGARCAWTGVGIDLKTATPSPDQVRAAVRDVLENERYKARCRELQAKMAEYDPIDVIVKAMDDVLAM